MNQNIVDLCKPCPTLKIQIHLADFKELSIHEHTLDNMATTNNSSVSHKSHNNYGKNNGSSTNTDAGDTLTLMDVMVKIPI